MRIAFMSWRDLANDQAGGSEVFVDRLASGLVARGHEVVHLCGGPVGERDYRVVDLGGTFTQYLRAPFVHHRLVRDWDLLVDVENGLPYFSPLWRRKPILACVHHVHSDQWDERFPRPLAAAGRFTESAIMPRVYDKVPFLAVSPSTATALEEIGIDAGRIHLLHNGVDPPTVTGEPRSDTPLFVCMGRLVPHKRIDLLLRLWSTVRPVVGGRLVVIGDGPERASLEAQAGPDVEFTGRVDEDEKWRLLGEAWALVHPAHHEGWGIVVIEAAEVGTPALGFDVPGVRDSIVDDETGILAATDEEFVQRWMDLASDPGLRERLGAGARQWASTFGWDAVADRFVAIADTLVESPEVPAR